MTKPREINNQINIIKLVIKKRFNDEKLQIVPAPSGKVATQELFINMSIDESIFKEGVSGILHIREPGTLGDDFNMIGDEYIEIEMESPGIGDAYKNVTFCVTDVTFVGDEADETLSGPGARANASWKIQFGSCETYFLSHLNYGGGDLSLFKSDFEGHDENLSGSESGKIFLGKIASEESGRNNDKNALESAGDFIKNIFTSDEGDELPKRGFVNVLAEKYFDPGATPYSKSNNKMQIEETHNAIIVYENKPLYPWHKVGVSPNIIQLMNYIAENSVTTDLKGVNYVFYADMDGWHFKSIRNIIQNSETSFFGFELDAPRKYFITDIDVPEDKWINGHPRIKMFRVSREYDHVRMFHVGAYASSYRYIRPRIGNPYSRFMHRNGVSSSSVHYNYLNTDWGGMDEGGRIEEYPLISKERWEEYLSHSVKTITDDSGMYGYFGNHYNAMDTSYPPVQGALGWKELRWQAMFDQTDLNFSTLYKIRKTMPYMYDDVLPTTSQLLGGTKYQYTAKANLKKKWDIYKHVVCCVDETEERDMEKYAFYAVLESATPIYQMPASKLDEDFKNESVDDPDYQKFRSNMYVYQFREVEFWDDIDKDSLRRDSGEGSTGEYEVLYYNDKHTYPDHEDIEFSDTQPRFYVVLSNNNEHGVAGQAYNINEFTNMGVDFGSDENEHPDFFVGPGVNVSGSASTEDEDLTDTNDYPEGNRMLPVGSYIKSGDDPCDGEFYYHKHIVKMYAIPEWTLTSGAWMVNKGAAGGEGGEGGGKKSCSKKQLSKEKKIYVFDVQNAHDGLCSCLN